MLAFGGRNYWGRNEGAKAKGIVVVFAWMCSEEKHLKSYVKLFSSLGWDSFVCHSGCFNLFAPSKATALAFDVLDAVVKELKTRPCPVVFASFSGGPKACMYKILQIIEGNCEAHRYLDGYRLVRECLAGYIYDSCPMDFYSEVAFAFFLHPSVLGVPHPPKLLSWTANSIRVGLNALFISWFESQRADYWQTLYASFSTGAPYLFLCSENDDLASCKIICNFAQRLQEFAADVKLVKWDSSPHVGHYRIHPVDYKAAVTELLEKAVLVYSQRIQKLEGDRMGVEDTHEPMSRPEVSIARKAARSSGQSIHGHDGLAVEPSDQFILPSSMDMDMDVGSSQDEGKGGFICFPSHPSIGASEFLGHIILDETFPKNVEEWDITDSRPSDSLNGLPIASAWSHSPGKSIQRSRL